MPTRRTTSADVAARAGVSRTTVSFVLNDRLDVAIPPVTRQRVLDAAASLSYIPHGPARDLARGSTRSICLVLHRTPADIGGDALLAEVLKGLVASARSAGFRVLVDSVPPGSGTFADMLRSSHADGLVVAGPTFDDAELLDLARDGYPIVLQGELVGFDGPSVDVDNHAAAVTAVNHLIGLGHRRIACITNGPRNFTAAAARLSGYRHALVEAGIAPDPTLEGAANFDASSGHEAILRILDAAGSAPDAVFAASDVVALGVLGGLRQRGLRVPDDLSLIGFDDISLAGHVHPRLTTIRVPARQLGEATGRAMIERLAGDFMATRTLLPTQLIVRDSVRTRTPVRRSTGTSPVHAGAP